MPAATQVFTSFLGGEISQAAQGRYDRPDYRTSMRVCLNGFPTEIGAWARRPGTMHASPTRQGGPARTVEFDFEQSAAVTIEFTDSKMRFRSGARLLTTNDARTVQAISNASPAVMSLFDAVAWATGDTALFYTFGSPAGALLQARQIALTKVDTTHFSLTDGMSGANIDGSTLGVLSVQMQVNKIQELTTPYVGGSWANVRMVQAETSAFTLSSVAAPQALTVSTMPADGVDAQFALNPVVFNDGPYLDPFTNGVQVSPSAKSGSITLTLAFPAYDATKAYTAGAFVTYSSVNYRSLSDQNVGNTPNSSPSFWVATSAAAAINNGKGFLGTDIGRLVRLLSEPGLWASGTTYGASQIVTYNPSGVAGASTYWQSLVGSNTGNVPGTDTSHWSLLSSTPGAVWTWGKITSLSNVIDRAMAGSLVIGNMPSGGGNTAAFDGNFLQTSATCAVEVVSSSSVVNAGSSFGMHSFVGKNYAGATPQQIEHVTIYPSTDVGFAHGSGNLNGGGIGNMIPTFTMNLRASSSSPVNPFDGTVLGTYGPTTDIMSPITIISTDQSTAWNYVWVELVTSFNVVYQLFGYTYANLISEVTFFSPPGTGTNTGCTVEILGPALLYTNPIVTWRLGLYSNTTGWPTCGCFDGGRLFLGGAVANRWDASVANGIDGGTVNFAPTDQYGTVSAASAISYTFNSKSVNKIIWMEPDLQGVIMGTQGGEWLVRAPSTGALAPTNVDARRVTRIGGANLPPIKTEHTTIFVKRYGRKLMEYFPDVYSGKFSAPNLADKAAHLTETGILELAYTEAVNSIVWGRCTDGSLFGISYRRDALTSSQGPAYYGWHSHELGSGRIVESLCAGPSVGGDLDTLTMVTNDAAVGQRHVEILTDATDEDAALSSCWFLDNAVNPTSVSIDPANGMTINGLWHLNGKTVQVFAGGLDCGDQGDLTPSIQDFVVANGSVTVPYGDSISAGPGGGLFTAAFAGGLSLSQIVVGFTYNSDGRLVRLIAQTDTGARNGPGLGGPSRTHRAAFKLVSTRGLSIGGNFDRLLPCEFKMSEDSATDLAALSTYSGIWFDQVKDDFTYGDSLCWRVSRPFPCMITAAAQNLRTEDM